MGPETHVLGTFPSTGGRAAAGAAACERCPSQPWSPPAAASQPRHQPGFTLQGLRPEKRATAVLPSCTAWRPSSPGSVSRTAVCRRGVRAGWVWGGHAGGMPLQLQPAQAARCMPCTPRRHADAGPGAAGGAPAPRAPTASCAWPRCTAAPPRWPAVRSAGWGEVGQGRAGQGRAGRRGGRWASSRGRCQLGVQAQAAHPPRYC